MHHILDRKLLNCYLYLSTMEFGELTEKIDTMPHIILDNLSEADGTIAHF